MQRRKLHSSSERRKSNGVEGHVKDYSPSTTAEKLASTEPALSSAPALVYDDGTKTFFWYVFKALLVCFVVGCDVNIYIY